jgi:hypothetical protein
MPRPEAFTFEPFFVFLFWFRLKFKQTVDELSSTGRNQSADLLPAWHFGP